ncbi:MAG TPA: phytanoyl-CoA dioxygenase family protein [Planctomycetota bacterium]|nr:phytanoyl-CoA dioxygenase family protein [Planctomycetota bacterium]
MADAFARPLPALTPEQRYYLDVNGYVVIPNVLSADEVAELMEAIHGLKDALLHLPPGTRIRNAHLLRGIDTMTVGSPVEAHPAITAYCTHPRLVGMAEELIGGDARICEVGAIINRRAAPGSAPFAYSFHTGTDIPFASHVKNGLYHCSFVKTLTNLTELRSADDGGTVVIAGSHKIDLPAETIIAAAMKDPRLIHQVVAPAGSTLLFSETLLHSTAQIRSDRERTILICGYNARVMPSWDSSPYTPEFVARLPESHRALFLGVAHWTRGPRYRTLDQPADPTAYANHPWHAHDPERRVEAERREPVATMV